MHSLICVLILPEQDETACLHGVCIGQNAAEFMTYMIFQEHHRDFTWPLVSEASGEAWLRAHKEFTETVRHADIVLICVSAELKNELF